MPPTKSKMKKKSTSKAVVRKKPHGNQKHDWDQIQRLYVEGVPVDMGKPDGDRDWLTLKEISERMHVPYDSIREKSSDQRWTALKAEYQGFLITTRQRERAKKLSHESTEFDDKALQAGKLGMQLATARLGEIATELNAKSDNRKEVMERLKKGMPVQREELYSAIRYSELESLGRALQSFQEIGMKALGTNIEHVEVGGSVEVDHTISVNQELSREDKGRLAGFMAVLERTPQFAELMQSMANGEDVIEGEFSEEEEDDLPDAEFEEDEDEHQ